MISQQPFSSELPRLQVPVFLLPPDQPLLILGIDQFQVVLLRPEHTHKPFHLNAIPIKQISSTYCRVASLCLLFVDSSCDSSRFHLSLFALYSFFLWASNAFLSISCRLRMSLMSFFSAAWFCFSRLSSSCWCFSWNGKLKPPALPQTVEAQKFRFVTKIQLPNPEVHQCKSIT